MLFMPFLACDNCKIFFLVFLEWQNYPKYLTLVLKSVRQGRNSFPQSLAINIFCGKESKSIPKIHPHKANNQQNPHYSGHKTVFQMLQIAGWFGIMKSKMKRQKCEYNTFVTFLPGPPLSLS